MSSKIGILQVYQRGSNHEHHNWHWCENGKLVVIWQWAKKTKHFVKPDKCNHNERSHHQLHGGAHKLIILFLVVPPEICPRKVIRPFPVDTYIGGYLWLELSLPLPLALAAFGFNTAIVASLEQKDFNGENSLLMRKVTKDIAVKKTISLSMPSLMSESGQATALWALTSLLTTWCPLSPVRKRIHENQNPMTMFKVGRKMAKKSSWIGGGRFQIHSIDILRIQASTRRKLRLSLYVIRMKWKTYANVGFSEPIPMFHMTSGPVINWFVSMDDQPKVYNCNAKYKNTLDIFWLHQCQPWLHTISIRFLFIGSAPFRSKSIMPRINGMPTKRLRHWLPIPKIWMLVNVTHIVNGVTNNLNSIFFSTLCKDGPHSVSNWL